MDFAATIVFLILYFVRPQDWVPAVGGLNVVKPIMALGFLGLATRHRRKPPWGIMTTPHEWVMLSFLIYGCYADQDWLGTLMTVLSVAGFYLLASQSLTEPKRLDRFFGWWAACVSLMCMIGVATDMGMDITGARELIDNRMGRLSLNTWLMDNPNALGHTGVTAFPLVYFTMVYRRDVGLKLLAIPVFVLVAMCVIATQSKGAYLSAAAGISAALLVGRSVSVQVALVTLLVIVGSTVATMLPRMVDRESMKHDEGVMGRALAFEAARTAYQTTTTGWNRFVAEIQWEGETVKISTHSSLVQIGADLGSVGLFLYLSVLGCSLRSSLTLKTDMEELERARCLLFSLLVGYFVSGWMINRSYHTEYFLLAGAATAFHKLAGERRLIAAGLLTAPDAEESAEEIMAHPVSSQPDQQQVEAELIEGDSEEQASVRRMWRRYGIIDFAIGYGLLQFTLWFWDYLINYFNVE